MFTRKDYLSDKCTHRAYYAQFVTPQVIALVTRTFGAELLNKAILQDENLNNIGLANWDRLADSFACDKKMRELGDYPTLAGKVCILKEAAHQITEGV